MTGAMVATLTWTALQAWMACPITKHFLLLVNPCLGYVFPVHGSPMCPVWPLDTLQSVHIPGTSHKEAFACFTRFILL